MAERSVANFIENLVKADDLDLELARQTVEAAGHEDSELPFVLRACAIAHHFDVAIVGVLRDAPDDIDANKRLTSLLSRQTFVSERRPGVYVYHDNMRERLLRDWRSDENRDERDVLNGRLLGHYWKQHEDVVALGNDLVRAGPVIRRASAKRYVQLAAELERSLLGPLLEALYHAAARGVADAYSRFVQAYELHESAARLGVCATALTATREYLGQLQPESEIAPAFARLDYWEGRLLIEQRCWPEAEAVLRRAIERAPDMAGELRSQRQLVRVLHLRDRLPEAVAACQKHAQLAEEAGDTDEICMSKYELGVLKWTGDELAEAADVLNAASAAAARAGNTALIAHTQLALAGVSVGAGHIDRSYAHAWRAHDISRSEARSDGGLARAVSAGLATVFGRLDRRYADTLFAEARALSPLPDDAPDMLDQWTRYADVLRTSGQLRRARRVINEARPPTEAETAEFLLEDALIHGAAGSPLAAIAIYDRIAALENEGASAYVVAASYANRATQAALRGEWQEAFAALDAAADRWQAIGHERHGTLVELSRASILRRSGAVDEAAEALQRAEELPRPENVSYLANYHEARAEVLDALARYDGARESYGAVFALVERAGSITRMAQAAADAARVAAQAAMWDTAAEWAQSAASAWTSAADADEYEPDEQTVAADEDNARGIAALFGGSRDGTKARELLEAAVARVPDQRWYKFNLAVACAACDDWSAAADTLEEALEGAPAQLRNPDILFRLVEYRTNLAERLQRQDTPEAALDAYQSAAASLPESLTHRLLLQLLGRIGDGFLRLDRSDLALPLITRGRDVAREAGSEHVAAIFDGRLAIIAASDGDTDSATALARASIELAYGRPWLGFWALVSAAWLTPMAKRAVLRHVLREIAVELQNGGTMDRFEAGLTIARPPQWFVKESVTVLEPSGQANVIASTEPVRLGMTTREYADAAAADFERDLPGYQELVLEDVELADGRAAIMRRFEWAPPDKAKVMQISLCHVDGDRGLTATGTTTAVAFPALQFELEQLLLSVALDGSSVVVGSD